MNILLIGSGGREHALAWKIAQSPLVNTLYCAPGNAGIADCAKCVALNTSEHKDVIDFCNDNNIELVVVGPEGPLVEGIADALNSAGINVFGPSAAAAQLEGSKGFTKDLCARYNIPTAAYGRFTNALDAKNYVETNGAPIVVKADGLAAGKGVIIAETVKEAMEAIDFIFEGAFGNAGAEVVVEEFMEGEEASFFALSDGHHFLSLATAQDHKAVGEGDVGPNTGGMGAYSPAPVMTPALIETVEQDIIKPTVAAMDDMGHPYKGVLFAGLMITADGPKLIEYNCRFGDPECQVLLSRLKSDIVPLLIATAKGNLKNASADWYEDTALTVVMATKGYPGKYEKGSHIGGVEAATQLEQTHVFHAGTANIDNVLQAVGGRVLNVTAMGESTREAQKRAYIAVDTIEWPEGFCRRDIGWRAIERKP
ncbi:phosphoribosylamine--glycine ligase [Kordiimonas aquimaris]|uniref:phosphoribosylamine--glycine ligase n=1 Tax=Kordiimonas aquimaris TaxID=707591 RepID=UPI0021D06F8C|nr:phosphoribosylamine--glycine ligase [Kordiimonas aquimaris]